MRSNNLQIGKLMAAGPKINPSALSEALTPVYTDNMKGMDFDKTIIGESVFLNGLDKWGDPKKRVGR